MSQTETECILRVKCASAGVLLFKQLNRPRLHRKATKWSALLIGEGDYPVGV